MNLNNQKTDFPPIENKKAYFDYHILDSYTSGIVLRGTEIKSIRNREVNFKDSFCIINKNEIFIRNFHIAQYKLGTSNNHEPERLRKLLLKKNEIKRIDQKLKDKGLTVVPLKLFINAKGLCKLEIAVVKGKKLYDKRESLKKKEARRELRSTHKYS